MVNLFLKFSNSAAKQIIAEIQKLVSVIIHEAVCNLQNMSVSRRKNFLE